MNIKLSDQDRENIIKSYLDGILSGDLAKKYNVTTATVRNVVKAKGFSRNPIGEPKKYVHISRNEFYKINNLCLGCSKKLDRKGLYCNICLTKYHRNDFEIRNNAKFRVFDKYGNMCTCCSLTDSKYFTIDHMDGNGTKHTKELGTDLYLWLDKQSKLSNFQILCWNCNGAKGFWGMCPHQSNFKWKNVKNEAARQWRVKIKKEVLRRYGESCVCCGETIYEFLTIDHINKKGYEHRKEIMGKGSGKYGNIYHWLKDNNYPEGFRILCLSCNAVSYKENCHNILLNEVQDYAT